MRCIIGPWLLIRSARELLQPELFNVNSLHASLRWRAMYGECSFRLRTLETSLFPNALMNLECVAVPVRFRYQIWNPPR
jgi:hypothetical protein